MTTAVRFAPKSGAVLAITPEALDVCYAPFEAQTEVEIYDGIAIVAVVGPLDHHQGSPFDNYDSITHRLEAAFSNEETRAVVMCFDSPGGDAAGMIECHRKIKAMREKHGKPIYAYSNETMASAAYGIGSACDEIWLPSTGILGSVGVISVLEDRTKQNAQAGIRVALVTSGTHKADRRPDRELTDEILGRVQEQVDYFAKSFWSTAGKARGVSAKALRELEAGVFYGEGAVKVGLADGVAGWDEFFELVRSSHGMESGRSTGESLSAKQKQGNAPQRSQEMRLMSTLLKANQEKKELLAKLSAATTDEERISLAAALTALSTSTVDAKMVKHQKVTEKYEEDDSEDEEEDEEDEEEESKASAEEDDEDDEDDDEDGDDDEKCAKALLSHNGRKAKALLTSVRKLTGKKSLGEVFGALDALSVKLDASSRTAARVEKLERDAKRSRVLGMIKAAQRDGKVTPAQAGALLEAGMSKPKWLKGYLETLDKKVTTAESAIAESISAASAPDVDAQLGALARGSNGMTDADRILSAATTGLRPDEAAAFKARFDKAADKANGMFNATRKGPRF